MLEQNRIPGHISVGPVEPPFQWWDVLLNTMTFDNTCVNIEELSSSGTFCAVTDAAVHKEINVTTLETIGRLPQDKIQGTNFVTQFSTAHSKVCKRDGLTYNYFLETGIENWAHIVRTNKDLSRESIGKIKVASKFSYVHEVSVTDNYAIVVLCPVVVNMKSAIQKGCLLPNLEFDPSQFTKICMFDLNGTRRVKVFDAPAFWCYHHVNAYEDGSSVVLDLIAYEAPDIASGPHGYLYLDNMKTEETRMKQEREGTVWRFTLDLNAAAQFVHPKKKVVYDDDTGLPCTMELISVSPDHLGKPYEYVYGFTGFHKGLSGYMDWAIRKQDIAMNSRHGVWYEEFMYPGEVTFVRNPLGTLEDDGVLLSTVYDSRRGENFLLVLNASNMKELARAYTGVGL
jgi:beta,beta-carotene 9',10'-dioxygenase